MITPVVLAKLLAGVFAVCLAIWLSKDLGYEIEQSKKMSSKE